MEPLVAAKRALGWNRLFLGDSRLLFQRAPPQNTGVAKGSLPECLGYPQRGRPIFPAEMTSALAQRCVKVACSALRQSLAHNELR